MTVYNHVSDLILRNTVPVVGVFFGEEKWAWEDVLTRKQSFMDMLVGATSRSEPVFLKVQVRGRGNGIMSKPGEKKGKLMKKCL